MLIDIICLVNALIKGECETLGQYADLDAELINWLSFSLFEGWCPKVKSPFQVYDLVT